MIMKIWLENLPNYKQLFLGKGCHQTFNRVEFLILDPKEKQIKRAAQKIKLHFELASSNSSPQHTQFVILRKAPSSPPSHPPPLPNLSFSFCQSNPSRGNKSPNDFKNRMAPSDPMWPGCKNDPIRRIPKYTLLPTQRGNAASEAGTQRGSKVKS